MIADPGGSGLNDRVDALGGHLWLHSSPAPATVRAELPLRQTHAQRYLRSTSKDVATNRHTSLQQGGVSTADVTLRMPAHHRQHRQLRSRADLTISDRHHHKTIGQMA